jgi:hypothetical protein
MPQHNTVQERQTNAASPTGAQHHYKAAEHHEEAARHHHQASKYYEQGEHQKAAHQAHIAHGHHLQALHHGEEAAKLYRDEHCPKCQSES